MTADIEIARPEPASAWSMTFVLRLVVSIANVGHVHMAQPGANGPTTFSSSTWTMSRAVKDPQWYLSSGATAFQLCQTPMFMRIHLSEMAGAGTCWTTSSPTEMVAFMRTGTKTATPPARGLAGSPTAALHMG